MARIARCCVTGTLLGEGVRLVADIATRIDTVARTVERGPVGRGRTRRRRGAVERGHHLDGRFRRARTGRVGGLRTDALGTLLTDETLTSVDDNRIVAAGDARAAGLRDLLTSLLPAVSPSSIGLA